MSGFGFDFDPWGKNDNPDDVASTPWDQKPPDDADPASPNVFDHSWRPVDLTPVLEGTWTPILPTVGRRTDDQPLLYAGRVHTLASESEAGKTWLALSIARDELDAGDQVVYLDFEDDEGGIVGRLLALGTKRDTIRDGFTYVRPAEPLGAGINRDDLRAVLVEHQPTLVVLDGITAAMTLHGYDVISNRDVADFARILPTGIAATGAAVLLLDHVTKSGENRGRYALGAVHKLNGVTGASLILETVVPIRLGSTGRSRVRIAKDRPAQLRRHALPDHTDAGLDWFADLVVESHGDDFVELTLEPPNEATPTAARKRPTIYMRRVSDVLEEVTEALSQRAILDRVTGKSEHVRSALAALVDEGYVAVTNGTRGAQLHHLSKPFTEATS